MDAIDANGIDDNTLVWFFSDNGGVPPGDNRPLNGAKGTVFEGGIRVAAAARWPARIAAGGQIDVPLAYIDVMPTLMRVAGVGRNRGKPLDGVDVLDVLTGKATESRRDLYSYIGQNGEDHEQITLMEATWKLVVIGPKITSHEAATADHQVLLFPIMTDPNETNNVAAQHPEVVARMWNKLREFRALQPADAVPPYRSRENEFSPLPEWKMPDDATSSEQRGAAGQY